MDPSDADELIANLRDREARSSLRRIALRVVGTYADNSEEALAGVPLEIFAEDGTKLGSFITDGNGIAIVEVGIPAEAATVTPRVRLVLRGERQSEAQVVLAADLTAPTYVRVPLGPVSGEAIPISEVLSGPLLDRLRQAGISTFEQLLGHPEFEDRQDPDALATLRGRARLTLAAPDLDESARAALIARDLGHGVDIARLPRTAFVRTFADVLGGEAAANALREGVRDRPRGSRHSRSHSCK